MVLDKHSTSAPKLSGEAVHTLGKDREDSGDKNEGFMASLEFVPREPPEVRYPSQQQQ